MEVLEHLEKTHSLWQLQLAPWRICNVIAFCMQYNIPIRKVMPTRPWHVLSRVPHIVLMPREVPWLSEGSWLC